MKNWAEKFEFALHSMENICVIHYKRIPANSLSFRISTALNILIRIRDMKMIFNIIHKRENIDHHLELS